MFSAHYFFILCVRLGKIPNNGEEDNGDDIDGAGKGSNLFIYFIWEYYDQL